MRLLRPAAALTAALGLACAGAVTLAPGAAAATAPDATSLASYLTANLVDGDHYEPFGPGFADIGLTIDGGLALAATGNPTDAVTVGRIATYLDAASTGGDYYEPGGDPQYLGVGYAGKLALLAEAAHRDPRSFAGGDLIKVITDNVCTAATVKSDPTNCPAPGAFFGSPSVFKQTLPILAAARAGVVPDAAVQYLLSLQRPDGGWPSEIPPASGAVSDPDSTAMAVQALSILPDPTAAGTYAAAAGKGVDYLAATQAADGSWQSGANAESMNSTGLALQAFQISSTVRDAQAGRTAKALAFFAAHQNGDGGLPVAGVGQSDSDVRASVQVLSGVLGVPFGTVVTPVVVQRTATTVPAATAAASYLVSQLVNGDHLERSFDVNGQVQAFVDQSTTGDLAYGLLASGGQDAALGKVLAFLTLDTTLKSYVSGSNFGDDADSVYAGATAKLAFLLQLAGQDPTDVGVNHLDLIAQLQGRVTASGRVSDKSGFSDQANVLGQSFAVLALTAAGDTTLAAKTRTALLAAQCPDGGFPTSFDKATCTSSPDATGLAVQALNAGRPTAGATATAAPAALTAAVTWLNGAQKTDGSFPGDSGVTNSTGYAALGLLAVGQDATAPRSYLASVANADGGLPINAKGDADDALATAQALPALAGVSFLQIAPAVVRAVSTVAAPNPPTTTPPTTTDPSGPSGPGTGTGGGSGAGTAPGAGASGQGGGSDLAGSGSLPDTGADVLGPLGWALLALLVGTGATVWGSRRPRPAGHAARRH